MNTDETTLIMVTELFDDEDKPREVLACKKCGQAYKTRHDVINFCSNCGRKIIGEKPFRMKKINNIVEENKTYEIDVDCMWDREYMKWVPTIYQCGRCHVRVNKTDTICPHCRSKLNPIKGAEYDKRGNQQNR